MTQHASGCFDVTLTPKSAPDVGEGATLARLAIDKRFHGDLDATERGEMLSAMAGIQGSAGYVAIARVSGRLHGQSGSFVRQHSGTMTRGDKRLELTVVPDSAIGELAGLTGTMAIEAVDGEHFYRLDHALPDAY